MIVRTVPLGAWSTGVQGESGAGLSTWGGSGRQASSASQVRTAAAVAGCSTGRMVSTTHARLAGRPTTYSRCRRPG